MGIEWWSQLKQHRINRGMSQEQVADAMGVSRQHISRMENGTLALKLPFLLEVLQLYGVVWRDAFVDSQHQTTIQEVAVRGTVIQQITEMLRRLDIRGLRSVLFLTGLLAGKDDTKVRVRSQP